MSVPTLGFGTQSDTSVAIDYVALAKKQAEVLTKAKLGLAAAQKQPGFGDTEKKFVNAKIVVLKSGYSVFTTVKASMTLNELSNLINVYELRFKSFIGGAKNAAYNNVLNSIKILKTMRKRLWNV